MNILDGIPKIVAGAMGKTIFRDAVLSRTGAGTGPAYDPGQGTTQRWPCRALVTEYRDSVRAAGLVSAKDRKLLILSASLPGVEPREGDVVTVQGASLRISSEGGTSPAVKTDPANAAWSCRASG